MTGVGLFRNVSAFFMYHTIPVFLYKLTKSRGSGKKNICLENSTSGHDVKS